MREWHWVGSLCSSSFAVCTSSITKGTNARCLCIIYCIDSIYNYTYRKRSAAAAAASASSESNRGPKPDASHPNLKPKGIPGGTDIECGVLRDDEDDDDDDYEAIYDHNSPSQSRSRNRAAQVRSQGAKSGKASLRNAAAAKYATAPNPSAPSQKNQMKKKKNGLNPV